MTGTRTRTRLAGCGLLAAAAGVLTGCSGGSPGQPTVGTVSRGTVTQTIEAPAEVTPRASVTLTAPASGTVAELLVHDGDPVNPGDVIAVIDSPAARQQLQAARAADAQAARATVDLPPTGLAAALQQADTAAAAAFDSAQAAVAQIQDPAARAAAQTALAQAEAQYAAARAGAQAAISRVDSGVGRLSDAVSALTSAQRVQTRAAVAAAQRTVDALTIRAPISGLVSLGGTAAAGGSSLLDQLPSSVQSQAAAVLGGGGGGGSAGSGAEGGAPAIATGVPVAAGTPVATVTDASTLTLTAQVDETDVLLVKPGQRATVSLDAVPDASYAATVAAVDAQGSRSARGGASYRVTLHLGAGELPGGGPAPRPRAGMSAVVDVQVRTDRQVPTVPTSAIVRDGNQDAVWLVEDGRAHRHAVTLGAQGDTRAAVLTGLRVGDRIVAHGADRVREGQRVG